MSEMSDDFGVDSPYYFIILKFDTETSVLHMDLRGLTMLESYTILSKAAENVYELLNIPVEIVTDDQVFNDFNDFLSMLEEEEE